MSTVAEIVMAVEHLDPEDFLKLRNALEQVEERLWDREEAAWLIVAMR